MSKSYFGIDNLIEKLKNLFYQHLKQFLPSIYEDLKKKKQECTEILESLGDMSFQDNTMMTINSLVHKFSDKIQKIFSGTLADNSELEILPVIKDKFVHFLKKYKGYKPSSFLNVFIISYLFNVKFNRVMKL